MAKMMLLDAVVVIVFMVQTPRGGGRSLFARQLSDCHIPSACMDSFGGKNHDSLLVIGIRVFRIQPWN